MHPSSVPSASRDGTGREKGQGGQVKSEMCQPCRRVEARLGEQKLSNKDCKILFELTFGEL